MDETGIDRDTMARLARSLSFIKSPDDPVVTALKQAAESGTERDIKRKSAGQHAASGSLLRGLAVCFPGPGKELVKAPWVIGADTAEDVGEVRFGIEA